MNDERKKIKEDLFNMLRNAYQQRNSHNLIFEDKSKHDCIIRKGSTGDEQQPQISLEMSVKGIFPK